MKEEGWSGVYPADFQKTRYEDINEHLLKSYYLKREVEELRKEIDEALAFNPKEDIVFYEGYFWRKVNV